HEATDQGERGHPTACFGKSAGQSYVREFIELVQGHHGCADANPHCRIYRSRSHQWKQRPAKKLVKPLTRRLRPVLIHRFLEVLSADDRKCELQIGLLGDLSCADFAKAALEVDPIDLDELRVQSDAVHRRRDICGTYAITVCGIQYSP